jgi:hypothetical protein
MAKASVSRHSGLDPESSHQVILQPFQIYLEVIMSSSLGTSAATRESTGAFWPEYSRGLFEPDSSACRREFRSDGQGTG